MERLVSFLLVLLIAAVLGVGFVVVRAEDRAHQDAERQACLTKAQATATIALLTPTSRIDEDGRLAAIQGLGERIDAC